MMSIYYSVTEEGKTLLDNGKLLTTFTEIRSAAKLKNIKVWKSTRDTCIFGESSSGDLFQFTFSAMGK